MTDITVQSPETAAPPGPTPDAGDPHSEAADGQIGASAVDLTDLWARRIAMDRLLEAATAARVPWSYALTHLTDPANALYREHLAAVYVARRVGLPEPASNGYDIERMEHDLAALADFGCLPLHDFAERHRAASLGRCGG